VRQLVIGEVFGNWTVLAEGPSTHEVECAKCHDQIYSRYDGEFVTCKCGAISVDQTPYYGRSIGDPKDFIQIQKKVLST